MKRYIKSGTCVYCGKQVDTNAAFDTIINIAKTHIVGCISACTVDEDLTMEENESKNLENTEKLRLDLDRFSYDYFETLGGWVEPDGTESEETSFIVIGPKYEYTDVAVKFVKRMTKLCGKYDQWAVMIIDWVDPTEVSDEIMHNRYDAYRTFYHNDFRSDEADKSLLEEESDVYKDLESNEYLQIHPLNAYYLDRYCKRIKQYNNVTPNHIGQFFTQLARNNGAERMTLLASTYFNCGYQQRSPRDKYILASSDIDTITNMISEQKLSKHYAELVDSRYSFYVNGD